jgi:hypothetical protein
MSVALCLWCGASPAAEGPFRPREGQVATAGLYVPVRLDAYAADRAGVEFPSRHVVVAGVPFDLVGTPSADNLYLKSAQWPDWQEDPSSYYAAYDRGSEAPDDPRRPLLKVPVADYAAAYLLAAADDDLGLSSEVSLRIGVLDGPRRTTLHDFSAEVPRWRGKRNAVTQAVFPVSRGNLYLVRVPIGTAFAQDFTDEWGLDLEVTKQLRLAIRRPDPCRYQVRPLGLPSGVHLFGMTLMRSPIQLRVSSNEAGHVFNEPRTPTFHVRLHGVARKTTCTVEAVATDYYGQQTVVRTGELTVEPGEKLEQELEIGVARRGYHELSVRVMSGRSEVVRRETTFALLPANTRRHRDESPFGVWDFSGTHYTPSDPDIVGPLYAKAGLRYGMFGFSAETREKYGVLAGNEPRSADVLAKSLEKDPRTPRRVLIFHEHAISGPHIMRTPDVFTGRSAYQLDVQEQKRFDQLWQEAVQTAQATRRQFPDAKLAFGNGNPQLLEEFLRRKFPAELFDSRGNEAGSFMRMPETQPLDFVANNASLWMDRQILDHYGYADKPITQCYEICYPNTNPGNLSLRTQANYFVRHILHSLAWGVPVIRPGSITDMGNSYYYSNWGASGLCFAKPDVRPKPSYVAIATLTQVLDGAAFRRAAPTGSTTVYAVEFVRRDGGHVTALWTLRGTRPVTLSTEKDSTATVTDLMGNETKADFSAGRASLEASASPVFVATAAPLAGIVPGPAKLEGRPPGKHFLISPLDKLAEWQVDDSHSTELEWYNFECPRRKGDFEFREVGQFEGENQVLQVAPRLPAEGSPYLPMYSQLVHRQGVELPGEPTEIGLMVHGNGGWGRVIFELQDAGGQRWISIGAAATGEPTRWMEDWMRPEDLQAMRAMSVSDWNTNDPWQRSRVNFEGWRFVRFPLPGNYPGEGYHWPYSSQWRHTSDGVVKYPLTFKRLILEMPEKMLYLTSLATPARREIYLKDLLVTYRPAEEAFSAE